MPELYEEIVEKKIKMEGEAIKAHQLRLKQVLSRLDDNTIKRMEKIDSILNGLTEN